ncbi:MAG: hypothetical protein ACRENS_13100, partial [Candidatus Eiseniibacteriota bacterium]
MPSGRAGESPQSEPSTPITPASVGVRPSGRAPTPGANEQTVAQIHGQAVWCLDARTGTAFEYQAQHLLSSGLIDAGWAPDSTHLCLGSAEGVHDLVVPDGSGGAYVAWVDDRLVAPDIYLTRFTASGSVAAGWPDGGLPVCSASLSQYNLDACADGAGGVILAWQDFRSGHSSEVYVERVSVDHAPASGWPDGGVPAANGAPDQYSPRLVSDGAGGAFVIWQSRESSGLGARIQHLSTTGSVASGWPAAGAVLLSGGTNVAGINASRDGSGHLDLVWRCAPDSSGLRLMSAKLDPSSVPTEGWAASATTLSSGAIENSEPRLARCADGSLLIGWAALEGTSALLKIQRLDANGALASGWPADGATLATTAAIAPPALLPISSGGAFVAWEDHRTAGSPDIFASRIDGDGTRNASWDSSGVAVCTAAGVQYSPGLSSDGNGGAIAVWSDAAMDASGSYLAARQVAGDPTQLLHVETNSEFAKLTWAVPTAEGESYQAYRADAAGEWSLLSNITPDDSSHAVLEDRAAPGGAEVQYRLAIQAQGVIRFLTPVTVKV